MTEILDGKKPAKEIKNWIRNQVEATGIVPKLAVILVGNNDASERYVSHKNKDCEECGIICETYRLSKDCKEVDLINLINSLNINANIHGIIVQLPLPDRFNTNKIMELIHPDKDVDCFNPINIGRLSIGTGRFIPCTPYGILELFRYYNIELSGKNVVMVGRSNIVGKPMATVLTQHNATVTLCHSKTRNLDYITRKADIVISAVGKPNFITGDMIRSGAIVVDVGINVNAQHKLCGDIDFEDIKDKVSYITPVPGGVGVMTRAMLMMNVWIAASNLIY